MKNLFNKSSNSFKLGPLGLVRLRQEVSSRPNPVSISRAKHSEINKKNTGSLKTEFDGLLFLKNVYFSENWDGGRPGRSWRKWNHNQNMLYKKKIIAGLERWLSS